MMSSSQKTLGTAIWIRINWLFRALSCLLISAPFIFLLYYFLYPDIHDAMRLAARGKVTVGVMGDDRCKTWSRRGILHYTRYQWIDYDGHFEEIMVREPYGRGTTMHVVYLPDSPSVVRLGNANTTFWQLFTRNGQSCSWLIALFVIPFGLFGALGAAFCLVNVVRGVSVDDLDKIRKQREDADRLKAAQKRQEKEQRAQAKRKPLFVLDHANEKYSDGLNAFERGKSYYNSKQYNDALRSFDVAVKDGLVKVDLLTSRGVCLQMLQRHQDAIDDFTKAIALDSEDCNIYYLRAISREAVGDLERGEKDIQKAVLLSQRNSTFNREYNDYARSLGYTCVGDMYSWYWRGAKGRVELARKMRR